MTDAATAAATWGGLDDFALQSSDSLSATPSDATYVAPTESSMQAAAANMTAQPDGTSLPDPQGGPVDGVEPYPLTYVEYAIAPAQPLLNADCTADTAAQTALNEWLTYLVGQGQKELPAGMAPLTSSLATQAQAAVAEVGTATPACTPTDALGSSAASPSPPGVGSPTAQSGLEGVTALPFGDSAYLGLADVTSLAKLSKLKDGEGDAGAPDATARAAAVSLAAFGKVSSDGWALPLLGILILMLLVPGLVFLASRRAPRLGPGEAASPQPDPQTQSSVDGGAVT